MMKNYKHIIWDWNGTLFNDVELCVDIINNLLTKKGLNKLTLKDYKDKFTFPIKDYYRNIGFDFKKYTFENLGNEWIEEYEFRKYEAYLFNNTTKVLKYFSNNFIAQSILSAYSQNTLIATIEYFNLQNYFTYIIGLNHVYATSKIEIGKELLEKMKENSREVLLIGDTAHDYEVANDLNIDCVLIANGHQSKKKLINLGIPVLDEISEIIKLF